MCRWANAIDNSDLLKRHATIHGDVTSQPDAPPLKRRRTQPDVNRPRAQKACRPCAEAKARCEGDSPCLRCSQKGLDCQYHPSRSGEALGKYQTSTDEKDQSVDALPSLNAAPDDQLAHSDLVDACDMAPSSRDGNIVVPEPVSQPVFPLSTPSGSGFGHMVNQTGAQSTNMSSEASRLPATYASDPTTLHDNLFSLDFLPLGVNDHTVSFDDLLNDDLFTYQGLSFGVEFAFNSPTNLDPSLISQFQGPQATLSSAVADDTEPMVTRSGVITPGLRTKLNITASTQAFKDSFWRWTPAQEDHGSSEQRNLSVSWDGMIPGLLGAQTPPPAHQRMTDSARGAVLAMILRTCEPEIYKHVLSNFPNSQVMTQLIHDFLAIHSKAEFPFIHVASVEIANESAEFLAILVAYGAALSSRPEVRKLGFALQEAQRAALPREVGIQHALSSKS